MAASNPKPHTSGVLVDIETMNNWPYVLDREETTVAVTDTTLTTIYTKAIAAGTLDIDWELALSLDGHMREDSAGVTVAITITFGATVMYAGTHIVGVAAALPWWLDLNLSNLGSTSSQRLIGRLVRANATTGTTTGTGSFRENTAVGSVIRGTASEASAGGSKTLLVQVQWSGAGTNKNFTKTKATLALV